MSNSKVYVEQLTERAKLYFFAHFSSNTTRFIESVELLPVAATYFVNLIASIQSTVIPTYTDAVSKELKDSPAAYARLQPQAPSKKSHKSLSDRTTTSYSLDCQPPASRRILVEKPSTSAAAAAETVRLVGQFAAGATARLSSVSRQPQSFNVR